MVSFHRSPSVRLCVFAFFASSRSCRSAATFLHRGTVMERTRRVEVGRKSSLVHHWLAEKPMTDTDNISGDLAYWLGLT